MTPSNKITLSRIILGPFFLESIIFGEKILALFVLFLNYALDGLDGFLARRRNEITKVGEIIDPLVDFLFLAFVCLSFHLTGIKAINWFFLPVIFIILSFVFSQIKLRNKSDFLHTKTKYFHTPLLYLSAVFIIFEIQFWEIILGITILFFNIAYFELFLRSLKIFFSKY